MHPPDTSQSPDAASLAAYGVVAESKYRREREAADKGLFVYDAHLSPRGVYDALLADATGHELGRREADTLSTAVYNARITLQLLGALRHDGPDWVAEDCDAIANGISDGFADLFGELEKRVEARRREAWLDGSDEARDRALVDAGEI
jgi:hypothetical protein